MWGRAAWLALALATVAVLGVSAWRRSTLHAWTPPRVVRYTALSGDRTRAAVRPPMLSDGRRLYLDTHGRLATLDIATGLIEPAAALAGFDVFDVAPSGREFLAAKLEDPGADQGLWVVPLAGAPQRVSDLRVTGAAVWSPGQQQIAYAFDRDLFVADADGANVRRIVSARGRVSRIHWSPDGQRLRFGVSVQVDRTSTNTLWEATVDGTAAHQLFADAIADTEVCCGTWTPDGRDYIFQTGSSELANLWVSRGERVAGREAPPTPLTNGPLAFTAPIASADGRQVFALARHVEGELVRFDERLREFTPYLAGLSAMYVNMSRDGSWLTYESYPDGVLWRARVDGGERRPLTRAPMRVDGSSLSPDEQWIVFRGSARPGSHKKNYLLPATGGAPEPLTDADVEQGIASWSPDSQQLAFGDVPESFGVPTGAETIHIYDRRTRRVSTLAGSRGLWTSRWSPDGRYIAALTIQGQRLRLYDVARRRWRELPVDHVNTQTWTRDGRLIYFDTEGAEPHHMRRVRIPEGVVEDVFDFTAFPRSTYWWTGLSHDDRPIVLRAPGGTQVYALDLDRR